MKKIMLIIFMLTLANIVVALPHEPEGFETKVRYNRFDDLYRYHHPANYRIRWDLEETTQYHDYDTRAEQEDFYDEWDKDIRYVRHHWTVHESSYAYSSSDNYGYVRPAPRRTFGHQLVIRTT